MGTLLKYEFRRSRVIFSGDYRRNASGRTTVSGWLVLQA